MKVQNMKNLIELYIFEACTEDEQQIIENWMNLNPENRDIVEQIKLSKQNNKSENRNWDIDKLWNDISKNTELNPPKPINKFRQLIRFSQNYNQLMKVAAVLLITLSIPYLYYTINGNLNSESQILFLEELTVGNKQRNEVVLSDGTKVTLDAGSVLKYPAKFEDESRDVYLEGEGYFEVKHNPAKPFIVHANNADVKVLGTKFNIRAWSQNNYLKVAVTEGRVSLRSTIPDYQNEEVLISKGQQSVLSKDGTLSKPMNMDVEISLGWMKNEALFDNIPLGEILDQLERWYDLDFQIDEKYLSDKITIHIQKKPVGDLISLIAGIMDLEFDRAENEVRFFTK